MDQDVKEQVRSILTPELCLAVYRSVFPHEKGKLPSGAALGQWQFNPGAGRMQKYYAFVYPALQALSKLPLETLLAIDLTELLPDPAAPNYPEHCFGMIFLLDQSRSLTTGYGYRYTRAFFDPLCEQLVRQLIALPNDIKPDGKQAWLLRGYSFDDWLARVLWFWAPLVHSDTFMTADRKHLKDWLHSMRAEVESHSGATDPFELLEGEDDVDLNAFQRIQDAGPPLKSYSNPDVEATISDYAFWWIRILNSHFAITDMCGHYPYWVRWEGLEWTEKDKEFMKRTNWHRYDPANEPVLEKVRKDYLEGVWMPMEPNPEFESERAELKDATAPGGPVLRQKNPMERGHGPRVRPQDLPPQGSSIMQP